MKSLGFGGLRGLKVFRDYTRRYIQAYGEKLEANRILGCGFGAESKKIKLLMLENCMTFI